MLRTKINGYLFIKQLSGVIPQISYVKGLLFHSRFFIISQGNEQAVRALIELGGNIMANDNYGQTPRQYAVAMSKILLLVYETKR